MCQDDKRLDQIEAKWAGRPGGNGDCPMDEQRRPLIRYSLSRDVEEMRAGTFY